MDFSECKSESDLKSILDNPLSDVIDGNRFYHYTSLTTAIKIFQSKKIRFSKISCMNDLIENTWCGRQTDKDYFFCLSQSEECFGMWAMYGGLKSDKRTYGYVKIAFPKSTLEEILKFDIKARSIAYVNLKGNEHKTSFQSDLYPESNTSGNKITISKNLAGYVKDVSWLYENEIRLYKKSMDKKEYIDFPFSKDLLFSLKIIPSPIADLNRVKDKFIKKLSRYNKTELENLFEANKFSGCIKI